MLLGLVEPSSGTATFDGQRYDELADPVRQVGALLEASGCHPGRTALAHLRILAAAARLARGVPERALEETGLADDAQRRVGEFSLGMRQRQGLAAGGYVVMAMFGVIGVAIGALVRNQVTVVVAVLVWMLVVERIVIISYPVVGRWMPGATTYVLLQMGPAVDPDGKLLSASASGLLLAAYTAVAIALALRPEEGRPLTQPRFCEPGNHVQAPGGDSRAGDGQPR